MSRSSQLRVVVACGLLVLSGLLCWRLAAADVDQSDVDLKLEEGNKEITNSVGIKLVRIKAGKFWMGSPNGEQGSVNNEHPRHQVELTKDFYVGVYEVTQKQYKAVMGKNPSYFCKDGGGAAQVKDVDTDDFPVEQTTWNDAQEFMKKLNDVAAEKSARRTYRLPTEAEWEYCCRGGADVKEPFTFDKPSASASSTQANFNGNQPYGGAARGPHLGKTCKVGSYKANSFGLFDMHGNVIEWVEDWHSETTYSEKDRKDPRGPQSGTYKILRSGGYNYDSQYCRSSYRNYSTPDYRSSDCGFRVVCTIRRD